MQECNLTIFFIYLIYQKSYFYLFGISKYLILTPFTKYINYLAPLGGAV